MRHKVVTLRELIEQKRWDPRAHLRTARPGRRNRISVRELAVERREQARPPTDPNKTFVYLGLENVETATGEIVGKTIRRGGDVLSVSKQFRAGDVLISRLRPNLNKVCCPSIGDGYCSGEFVVLIPGERTSARVLRELIASEEFVAHLADLVAGATLPRVSAQDILDQQVPIIDLKKLAALGRKLEAEDRKRKDLRQALADQRQIIAGLVSGSSV